MCGRDLTTRGHRSRIPTQFLNVAFNRSIQMKIETIIQFFVVYILHIACVEHTE